MGRTKTARRKAAHQASMAAHEEEAHKGDAGQPVDTETASPVPPASPVSQEPPTSPTPAAPAASSPSLTVPLPPPQTDTPPASTADGNTTPKKDKSETTHVDGTLTPVSLASSTQEKRACIVRWADLAESSGDVAEKDADDISTVGSATYDPTADNTTAPETSPLQQDGRARQPAKPPKTTLLGSPIQDASLLKKRSAMADPRKRARPPTEYPRLTNAAGREAAARERERIRAYRAGGIRFAPWNIPYRRRLQTMAVLTHCLSIAVTVSCFFFLCANPLLWPFVIPYLLHMLLSKSATDGRLRARSERFRRLPIWNFFGDYFPARLHKTHDLPPTRKYIFGYHPHGIISHGAFAAFATEALGFSEKFPGITNSLLTLDSNFRIPIYRDYILALGIQSVSKESITAILTQGGANGEGMGRAVTIVVGGARESLEAQPGTMHLVLAQRKGFVKMAMRTGADLVPVLAFGENDLYDQVSPKRHPLLHRLQMWVLRTLKFTLPFLHGRGIFNYDVGLMPYRRPMNVVVGRPIQVRMASEERMEAAEVERLHAEYVGELERMWETYRDVFARGREEEMQIIK